MNTFKFKKRAKENGVIVYSARKYSNKNGEGYTITFSYKLSENKVSAEVTKHFHEMDLQEILNNIVPNNAYLKENNLKKRLFMYRKTLSLCGIEKELELPARTIKMWLDQNTEPTQEIQDKISNHLKCLGRGL